MSAKTKSRGRPPGSRTEPAETVVAAATRCPVCGSTERGPYMTKVEQAHAGVTPDEQPYTHIVRRRCRCTACSQIRIDKTYENRLDQN